MQINIAITISRELGSGGSHIGKLVANRLGYAYIDRQILQMAAKELGVDEAELSIRRERECHIRCCSGLDRFDLRHYHLSIDTSVVDFGTATQMIASLATELPEEANWPWVNELI
ncbi:MAG TPA: hypothetical protein DCE18_12015 [Syntrophobacteraceae bacterium]|nr:hypothetical protein [Syntrophobacteraceae bacterium]